MYTPARLQAYKPIFPTDYLGTSGTVSVYTTYRRRRPCYLVSPSALGNHCCCTWTGTEDLDHQPPATSVSLAQLWGYLFCTAHVHWLQSPSRGLRLRTQVARYTYHLLGHFPMHYLAGHFTAWSQTCPETLRQIPALRAHVRLDAKLQGVRDHFLFWRHAEPPARPPSVLAWRLCG